jgi:trimeric autotransporter adhesin
MALTATDLFNDATTREIGGIGPDQVNLIVSDLIGVQQMLSAADPTINNLSDLHTHVIINQLNEEIASIENANSPTGTLVLGTDLGQFVGRAINDIHRDIIDIAQGDAGVQALFNPTPLPALNTPPAPFHDSTDQTTVLTQFIQDSNHLGQMAITIENNGFQGDIAGLVQQIQTFETNANTFDQSQGGLFSARFWNELRADGTAGTAANALIDGLQNHNAGEINAAAEQLAANSGDLGTNNLMADGGTYADVVAAAQATAVTPAAGNNPAADQAAAPAAPAAAPAAPAAGLTATDLFNDATTREIGGVGPDQVNLIVSDLIGVQQMLSAADPQINNLSDLHTHVIINQLNEEIASIENANSPTGTLVLGTDLGQFVGRAINDIHRDIIDIAQGDAGVQALFNPTPLPALNTPPAPFHDSTDQTTVLTQFIQDSNHLGQAAITIENNGFTGDIAGLVQQIQTFETNANTFDQSQGGLFSARFWNELRADGTAGTAANALIEGLQNHNAGEVNAAAEQLAANSGDLGTNNLMADGGTYADVVAAAQATAVTPVTPPAAGGGGGGGGGGTPPADGGGGGGGGGTPPADGGGGGGQTVAGLNPGDLYFENMFNDATRILEGGLWHNNVPVGNQGNGTDGRYTADLQLVQTGLIADVAANDFAGVQLTDVNKVLGDITTALGSVQGAVNNDANAEATLRTAHLDIINTIENDPVLQALSIKDNNPGFNFAPPELATPLNANTPHATFAELGAIFDDAQSKSLAGINADNLPAIQADLQTVHDGLLTLMQDHPQLFQGATGIHASTIVDQINLQLTNFDHQYGFNPDAAKATNDNFLDITDIVAGDPNLANMASGNGVAGWTGAPFTDVVPVRYQDNADQTNFWADFIASGNTLGAQAEQLVSTGTAQQVKAFVQTLQGWEHNIQNFDAAQGGVFEARFDNELLGPDSTVGADVAAMINGLQTHNAALVKAAADGFHANAMDVSGNNVPLNGGAFNPDGTTIADALSTATGPLPPAPVSLLTPAAPAAAGSDCGPNDHPAQTPAAPAAPAAPQVASQPASQPTAPAAPAAADHLATTADLASIDPHHQPFGEMAHHHFHHMWG